jgi:two-component system sensor histidine kinase AlgZ
LEWRHKVEAQARLQALQSRIRPHFLFNSLNTISELTATEPEQAEQAIASLSSLFRASLDEAKNMHTLDSEIHLCERYLELERWRLADKLEIEWINSIENTRTWQVPKLILQPLLENAVMHGADKYGCVKLTIDLRESKTDLSIKVVNSQGIKDQSNNQNKGNGIALNNIRERLFVLYDDQQAFRIRNDPDKYQVIMRLPKKAYAGLVDKR